MRYFFSEDRYGNTLSFNDIHNHYGEETIAFYIEQMRYGDANEPFNYAEGILPSGKFTRVFGFSPSELDSLYDYVIRNADLMFEIAREKVV